MHPSFLPGGPEELTPAWLTRMLREQTVLFAENVEAVRAEIIGQDFGLTGLMVRVQLSYTELTATAPSSVIVKLPLARRKPLSAYRISQEKDEAARQQYFARCAREVLFYHHLAPLSPLSTPQLYYGATDETTGRVILVLEDLHSARQGNVLEGCSASDAALVIDQLAQFHAHWWEHPRLETFPWLPRWGGDPHLAQQRYLQCLGPFLSRFGARLPQRVRKTIEALATQYGAVRAHLQQAPLTLVHADLHLDNLLFAPPGEAPGVTVIDWQSVAYGRGAIDVAHFLFGSLSSSSRRAVEADLLRRYHEGLLAHGVRGYDSAQLSRDCQWVLLWLLGATVVWLGSLDLDHLHGREQALAEASMSEESFAAFLDHEADTLLSL